MKITLIMFISAGLLAACQNPDAGTSSRHRGEVDESRATGLSHSEQKYCYVRLDGDRQQDSSFVQLSMRGETVSGIYNHIPYGKDARRGTVLGTANGDTLDVVWSFQQEGRQDTMRLIFLFDEQKLMQKSLTVDTATGRQFTPAGGTFSEVYERTDCLQ